MSIRFKQFGITLLAFIAQSAYANIQVTFIEGAPKDKFVIQNTGKCSLQDLSVEIDLSQSQGKLIFDTTETGAGVEVFQPFEVTEGQIKLTSQATVNDGDDKLMLSIPSLASKGSVSFTIDVDDTLAVSELGNIRVANSEIKNGMVKVNSKNNQKANAAFGSDSKATVLLSGCSI